MKKGPEKFAPFPPHVIFGPRGSVGSVRSRLSMVTDSIFLTGRSGPQGLNFLTWVVRELLVWDCEINYSRSP